LRRILYIAEIGTRHTAEWRRRGTGASTLDRGRRCLHCSRLSSHLHCLVIDYCAFVHIIWIIAVGSVTVT